MLINNSELKGTIAAGGSSMVRPADGATYFMVAVYPGATTGADVFGMYDAFNKYSAAEGKNAISQRGLFYGVLIKRDSALDSLPENWKTRVLLFDMPRGAGASLTAMMSDSDLDLHLLYLDADGSVMQETTDADGNTIPVPAPSIIKLTRDKSKPAAQMYSLTALPANSPVHGQILTSYEIPTDNLVTAIEKLNKRAATDADNFAKYGDTSAPDTNTPNNTNAPAPAPAPGSLEAAIAERLANGPLDAATLAAILNSVNNA